MDNSNSVDKCKAFRRTIEQYCFTSIARSKQLEEVKMDRLFEIYPFEIFRKYIAIICYRHSVNKGNMYLWDECQSVAFLAYWYSVGRCAVCNYNYIENYIKKMIRIYIFCRVAVYRYDDGYKSLDDEKCSLHRLL